MKVDCDGKCPCCSCQEVLDPVCAEDGKTYDNKCLAECAGNDLLSNVSLHKICLNVCRKFPYKFVCIHKTYMINISVIYSHAKY